MDGVTIWDAMALYDVQKYNQEEMKRKIVKKDNQAKLASFYQKQLKEKDSESRLSQMKASQEYETMLFRIKKFDTDEKHKLKAMWAQLDENL